MSRKDLKTINPNPLLHPLPSLSLANPWTHFPLSLITYLTECWPFSLLPRPFPLSAPNTGNTILMDTIFASCSLPNISHSEFISPYCPHPSTSFRTRCRTSTRRWNFICTRNCLNSVSNGTRGRLLGFPRVPRSSKAFQEGRGDEKPISEDFSVSNLVSLSVDDKKSDGTMLNCIAKPIVYTLFCIAVGFVPFRTVQAAAVAAQVVGQRILDKKSNWEEESNLRGHEYSDRTSRLLEAVSGVLRNIEEARKGNSSVEEVEAALKAVKLKKEELQKGILNDLYRQLRELRREKADLELRLEEVVDEVLKANGEKERLEQKGVSGGNEARERIGRLERTSRRLEGEYNEKWERVGEIEDDILRRETVALSFGVRELCFIERECDQLVKRFTQEMRAREKDPNRYKPKLMLCLAL